MKPQVPRRQDVVTPVLLQAHAGEGSDDKLDKREAPQQSGSDGDEPDVQGRERARPSHEADATPALVRGCDVSLLEPTTDGVSSLHASCVRLQVACSRCKGVADMRVALPKDGATMEPAGNC